MKARKMLERWQGDLPKCIALAKENLEWHASVNDPGWQFWRDVIAELEKI
jgi:hypothetical protein